MSVTCLIEGNHPELGDANFIDFGRFFPGLRDLWIDVCRPDINNDDYSFPLPKWRVIKLYAGLCSMLALRPRSHPVYPELNPQDECPEGGYWFIVKKSHIANTPEDEYYEWRNEFKKQFEVDREVLAQLHYVYSMFIAPVATYELGDMNCLLDTFWFDNIREFADQLVLLLRYDDIQFTAHV